MTSQIQEISTNTTRTEALSDAISRRIAARISRRSFLGRVGKGAIAASLGGAVAESLLNPPTALAVCSGINCSVQCSHLPGWGSNTCPTGTCECGCWCINGPGCANYKEWCDCCGGDYCNPHGCRCISSCGTTYPSCCLTKDWSPQGCGNSTWHIACRTSKCVTGAQCEVFSNECAGQGC